MKNTEFQDKMNAIQEKIGEDASGLILDEVGVLVTDNLNMNKSIEEKDEQIRTLKERNEKLLQVNGNLLQQVSMAEEPLNNVSKETTPTKKEAFDFRNAFDEYGNFKK